MDFLREHQNSNAILWSGEKKCIVYIDGLMLLLYQRQNVTYGQGGNYCTVKLPPYIIP